MTLTPPDPKRCQGEKPIGPFRLGGRTGGFERCGDKPIVILTEVDPGEDGLCGAMSLCTACLVVFNDQGVPPDVTVKRLT